MPSCVFGMPTEVDTNYNLSEDYIGLISATETLTMNFGYSTSAGVYNSTERFDPTFAGTTTYGTVWSSPYVKHSVKKTEVSEKILGTFKDWIDSWGPSEILYDKIEEEGEENIRKKIKKFFVFKSFELDASVGGTNQDKKFVKGCVEISPLSTVSFNSIFKPNGDHERMNTINATIGNDEYHDAELQVKWNSTSQLPLSGIGYWFYWRPEDISTSNLTYSTPQYNNGVIKMRCDIDVKKNASNVLSRTKAGEDGYIKKLNWVWYCRLLGVERDNSMDTIGNVTDYSGHGRRYKWQRKSDATSTENGVESAESFGYGLWCSGPVSWDYKEKKFPVWDEQHSLLVGDPYDLNADGSFSPESVIKYTPPSAHAKIKDIMPASYPRNTYGLDLSTTVLRPTPIYIYPVTDDKKYSLQDLYCLAWKDKTEFGQHLWDGMAVTKLTDGGTIMMTLMSNADTTLYIKKTPFSASDDTSNLLSAKKDNTVYSAGVPLSAGDNTIIEIPGLEKNDVIYIKPTTAATININSAEILVEN